MVLPQGSRFDFLPTTDNDVVTIPAGTALSEAFDVGGMNVTGLVFPDTWDAADLTVQASFDGGATWHDVVDDGGIEYSATVVPGSYTILNYMDLEGIEYIRFRSGTAAAPVNQAADRAIIVVLAK